MEIRREPRVDPRRSVPSERAEVVAYGVKRVMPRCRLYCATDISEIGEQILVLEPNPNQTFKVIGPRCVRFFCSPRRLLPENDADVKLIEAEHTHPCRMPAQEQDQICEQGADCAVFVEDQVTGPVRLGGAGTASTASTATQHLRVILFGVVKLISNDLLERAFLQV